MADKIAPGVKYGFYRAYLRSSDYWLDEYDWRQHEAPLNDSTIHGRRLDSNRPSLRPTSRAKVSESEFRCC